MNAKDREFIVNLIAFLGALLLAAGGIMVTFAPSGAWWNAGKVCMVLGPIMGGARAFFGMKKQ